MNTDKPTVLVVEDEQYIMESIRFLLERQELTVVCAEDGQRAVSLFNAETPDLVVLDLMIPRIDGFEVLRQIRQSNPPAASTPVLILSAKGQDVDRVKALDLGANGFVTKPYANKDLVVTVLDLLGSAIDG